MPRINQSVETMVMNDKGEMVSKRANKVMSWGDEPSYIKLYLQDVMYLSDMPKQYASLTACLLKKSILRRRRRRNVCSSRSSH